MALVAAFLFGSYTDAPDLSDCTFSIEELTDIGMNSDSTLTVIVSGFLTSTETFTIEVLEQ